MRKRQECLLELAFGDMTSLHGLLWFGPNFIKVNLKPIYIVFSTSLITFVTRTYIF